MTSDRWAMRMKDLLKAELKERKLTYADLADKLLAIGIEESEKNIAKKISRGAFKAVFLLQCLEAIGCDSLHLLAPSQNNKSIAASARRAAPLHHSDWLA